MKLKGVIGTLAGPGSITAILLLVLVIALAGAPQLQQKQTVARRIGTELAISRAHSIADALLSNAVPGKSLDGAGNAYRAVHLRNASTDLSDAPANYSRVIKKLRAAPTQPAITFERNGRALVLHYAVADGQGGILLLETSLAEEFATIGRSFGQAYLSGSALSYLIIGLLLIAVSGLRSFLRTLANLPPDERRRVITEGLSDSDGTQRRNLLPWLLALCALVFFIDVRNWVDSAVGIGYVLAVTLSLTSNRSWHSMVIEAVGVTMLCVAPLLAPATASWWLYLSNHAVTVFAIISTGLIGSAHSRKTRTEALAQMEAMRSRHETTGLRAALERGEAAEVQRREVIARMTMANQAAGISMWEFDLTTETVTVSADSAFSERLGQQSSHTSKDYLDKLVHPDDLEVYKAVFMQALGDASGANDRFQHRYRVCLPDGRVQHIQFHAQVVRTANGKAERIIGVDWEVTREVEAARALSEQAEQLREAEERLQRASVSSLEAHWDMECGNPTAPCWFSPSYAALTGYSSAFLATLTAEGLLELTHPDDRVAQREALRLHLTEGHVYDLPIRLRVSSGESRWFQLRGAVERNETGVASRMAGSIRDIHQQKLSEDLLREAQKRFERAVSGTQDALFDFDLQEGSMWHSPRFAAMLGYAPGELDSARLRNLSSIVHPDDGSAIGTVAAAHLRDNAPYDVEYRLRRKDGSWMWVRERAMAERDSTGKPLRLAGSIHDITEQRMARDAMISATAEAEAASRAKSTFLATMSHEIRTPMNGVIGMTGLLLDTGLDRVQRDYAETIRASADSLLTILNDILDFSKIEAGKLDIEAIELDLDANVGEVGSMLAFQAAAKGLELVVNVRPEVPDRVLGDPQRIRQCLLNLVGNAIKFTQSGEVVLEVCSLGQQNGRSLVHFEVRDTGMGIAPDTVQKLFQPFTQADSSTTRKFGGTGLGLSIVRKLVELMGGQAGAQSEPGKGSTFWFTLPLEPVVTAEEKSDDTITSPLGRRVLLVDDNETNRRVLSSQMVHSGYDVETAASAAQALTILHEQPTAFDVVVLDYHMPDMDGAMLGERIMRDTSIVPTRLMLLTSMDRSGDMQRFADIGFSAYLTKPVRTRELLDCLAITLSRNAQDWHLRSQPIITRGTLIAGETRRQYVGKVLLVEDNAINQRVARRFLERLGCEVHVVSDGAQAVAAYQTQAFGFILMDMQMPVMDGIEATQRIRAIENGGRRTSIVALTANAMMGTLERCLAAGMDDYLTKPLDISRLQDVLDRFLGVVSLPDRASSVPGAIDDATMDTEQMLQQRVPTSPGLAPAIRARLTDIADDDTDFIAELVDAFATGGEESIREMRAALVTENRAAMARAAHKLKGASSNLHIDTVANLAGDIEARAKAGKDEGLTQAIEQVVAQFQCVVRALHVEMAQRPPKQAAAG